MKSTWFFSFLILKGAKDLAESVFSWWIHITYCSEENFRVMLSLYAVLEVLITYDINTFAIPGRRWFGQCIFFLKVERQSMFMKIRGRLVIFWFGFREQRVTGTLVFILTGLSVFMAPILKVNIWNTSSSFSNTDRWVGLWRVEFLMRYLQDSH